MKLLDLAAHFTQVLPFADGIYTGLYYRCPKDPARKRAHAILFDPPIIPSIYGECADMVSRALAANEHWSKSPRWPRSGDSLDTLTLGHSIARDCCHITISNGEVTES